MTYTFWPFAEPVTLHRRTRGAPDSDGNDTWTEVNVSAKAALWPVDATEVTDAQDTSIRRMNIAFKPPVDLGTYDEVTARGERWKVDGAPDEYHSPLTNTEVERAVLKRVTG